METVALAAEVRSYNCCYAELSAALETRKKTTERNARSEQRRKDAQRNNPRPHRRARDQKQEAAAPTKSS